MQKALFVFVGLMFVLAACQKTELSRQPGGKTKDSSKIDDRRLFWAKDSGRSIPLNRSTMGDPTFSSGFGYGLGMFDPFLAFADWIHWLDYTATSVVMLNFGQDPEVVNIAIAVDQCWDLKVTTSKPVTIWRIKRQSGSGYGSMVETSLNQLDIDWTLEGSGRAGVVFAISSTDHGSCDWDPYGYYNYGNPNWYHAGNDPYQYGYNGYFNQNYFYYPSYPCSYRHQASTLKVTGTVKQCDGNGTTQTVDMDLSPNLSSSSAGYMPYFTKKYGTQQLDGRAINFDGMDYYQPVTY